MTSRRSLLEAAAAALLAGCSPSRPANHSAVKALLDRIATLPRATAARGEADRLRNMLKQEEQAALFVRLEAMGREAVPSMIDLMDDRRPIPFRTITLENHAPGTLEGLRHYGPELMVDAVAAILNQITGADFGFIYNGASEAERRATVIGWRRYRAQMGA